MNKTNLEYFITVYKHKNISKAAEEIHISRQALSKTIQDIEEAVGQTLFMRSKHGLETTPAADNLYVHAQKILREYDAIFDFNDKIDDIRKKQLNICAVDSFSEFFSSSYLKKFTDENPDIILNIQEMTEQSALDELRANRCDFAVVSDYSDLSGFKKIHLTRTQFAVIMSRDNPLAQKWMLDPRDIESCQIIGKNVNEKYYARFVEYCNKNKIRLNTTLSVSNSGVIQRLVSDNLGVAIIWDYNWMMCHCDDKIVFRQFNDEELSFDMYVVSNRLEEQTPETEAFIKFMSGWHNHVEKPKTCPRRKFFIEKMRSALNDTPQN